MPRFDVVGIGTAACDYLISIPRFPGPDEKVRAEALAIEGGGTVGTALVTAARLGLRTAFLGTLGGDEFGRFIRASLDAEQVDTSLVRVAAGARSPFAFCVSSPPHRNVFSVAPTTPPLRLRPGEMDVALDTRALHLDGTATGDAVEVARAACERGIDVSLDLQRIRPGSDELLAVSAIVVVAESFATEKWPGVEPLEAVRKLYRPGMRLAAITLGARGVVATEGGEPYTVEAEPVEVVDSTGAGDAFHGALLVGILGGHTIPHSLRLATHVAALSCQAVGGRTGLPRRDELGPEWL